MTNKILYEDNHLIAVEKLPGDLSQGDKSGKTPLPDLVKEYIRTQYNKPGNVYLGVIHRLDRPVGGVILFAKTSKALERMNKCFKERKNTKKYWALVEGRVHEQEGRLENYLKKNEKQNKSYVFNNDKSGAKFCALNYKTISRGDRLSILEIELETGRHHQIRCQLANMGHAIRGDVKYGAKRPEKDGYIYLHSVYLEFPHPTTKETICIESKPQLPKLWSAIINN